jgi:hypothetical protein
MKKIAVLSFLLLAIVGNSFSQFSLNVQGGLFRNKMDGSFTDASALYKSNLSAGVSIDYSRGKVFGWMLGYNKFNKSILFEIEQSGNNSEQIGVSFVAHEIHSGMLLRVGKHINLSIGSYIQINTNQIKGDVEQWEKKFYPIIPEDLYKKIETGYQGKLQLQFYLTDRMYVGAFANAGMSWTDLRTENWDKAWTNFNENEEEWKNGPMKNLYQHYGLCIGFRTKPKED